MKPLHVLRVSSSAFFVPFFLLLFFHRDQLSAVLCDLFPPWPQCHGVFNRRPPKYIRFHIFTEGELQPLLAHLNQQNTTINDSE